MDSDLIGRYSVFAWLPTSSDTHVESLDWRIENSYAPVALTDRTLRVQRISLGFGTMLRCCTEVLIGSRLQDLIYPVDWPALMAVICHLRLGRQQSHLLDLRYVGRTQRTVRCGTAIGALERIDGAITHYLLVLLPYAERSHIYRAAA